MKNKKYKPQKSKPYLSISSEGLGHSSRALAILSEFDKDEIVVGSYDYACERIKAAGHNCHDLNQEYRLIGDKGTFSVGKTIIKNHSWALKFNKMVKEEVQLIKDKQVSCVIADGRLVPVLAAEKLGLPCLVLTNQSAFYPFFAQNSALIKVFGKSFDWIMKMHLCSTEEIIIPDFPPPYTVCLNNLNTHKKVMKRTRFTGPLVSWDEEEIGYVEKPNENNPYIIVTLGGHSYRKPLFDNVIETAKKLPDANFDIFTTFEIDNLPDNVRLMGMVQNIAPYMKTADIVITQAGHSTAMELLTLGKQSIIIPDLKQAEQENNAKQMEKFKVANVVNYDELSSNKLCATIEEMLHSSTFNKNAQKFKQLAREINGRKQVASIIREYSNRLLRY